MALAMSLGARGMGKAWPNPAVGCVLVKNTRIVGRGWTQPGGRPHAEIVALAQAGQAARGATAFVTLEPCAHTGKTPPCAQALIDAGVSRVVSAIQDPDPRVAGQGHAMLHAAGVAVTSGVGQAQAARAHRGFFLKVKNGRPLVTLKLASSFDGRIATASGESKWITGPESRRMVHAMRARHDAVMVGGGTVRVDDPSLTVRGLGIRHQPVRVVCSRHLDLPVESSLARSARDVPVWLCHGRDASAELQQVWRGLGARLLAVEPAPGPHLDPLAILQALGGAGLTRVFCEGGSALAASLLAAGLVDELVGFTAGIGLGAEGLPSLGALGIGQLPLAPRFRLVASRAIGNDVYHHWERAPRTGG